MGGIEVRGGEATGVLRVLHVEDSELDAELVLRALRARGRTVQCERVETEGAMRAALGKQAWDVVLSDWSMPRFSAPAALAVLREAGLDLPFVIVSGTIGEEKAAEAMRAGAHDYILKDRTERLLPAIERELREYGERTERRRAELGLRQSQARFQRLAESGLVGIFVASASGEIREANDAFLSMLGYERKDLESGLLDWSKLTPAEWAPTNAVAIEQLRAHGVARPWEKRYLRKDGTEVPVLVGVARVSDDERVSISIDLTSQKNAEEGKRRAEAALQRTEEQFRQAQKMEAVGRLAGGVAHDFNNVLSVVLSYAELLKAELPPSDPKLEDLDEIRKAALRAAGLTRQLLTFSRQQVFEPRVLDLGDVLSNLENMMRRIVGEDVELRLRLASTWRVRVDPTHMEQVILNLVVNARDAMPTGGGLTIETADVQLEEGSVETQLPAKAGPYVMVAVTDAGCGIDAATQSHIFEPFFTTKPKGKGTGLGLSTVFGIVQQSGGSIGLRSEPGKGTTFTIYLPRVAAQLQPRLSLPPPTQLRGKETVLLVEDEDQVRTVAQSVLQRQGYEVLVARDPGEAMALCAEHLPAIHILVTDVVMPQLSGPELARRLLVMRPEMRVLCMSGYTDDAMMRHGVSESGVAFLQKPFTPQTLAAKVREVLDS